MVLFPDVIAAASKVASRFPDWIMLGGTWTLPSRSQASLLSHLQGLHSLLPLAQAQAQSQYLAHSLFSSHSQSQPQSQSQSEYQYQARTAREKRALDEALHIQRAIRERGRLRAAPGGPRALIPFLGFLMWSATGTPLLPLPVPPFAMGRGAYEEWLVHHMVYRVPDGAEGATVQSAALGGTDRVRLPQPGTGWAGAGAGAGVFGGGLGAAWDSAFGRQVVDASVAVLSLRLRPRGAPGAGVAVASSSGGGGLGNVEASETKRPFNSGALGSPQQWEVLANLHLAASAGSGRAFARGSLVHCPWTLTRCFAPLTRGVHFPGETQSPTLDVPLPPSVGTTSQGETWKATPLT